MHIMKEKKPLKSAALPLTGQKARKSRPLKEEDIAIWGLATEDVTAYAPPNLHKDHNPKSLKRNYGQSGGSNAHIISGMITLETFGAAPAPKAIANQPSSFQVDANLKKKFEKGDLPIEGKIDLHGLTLEQAHHRFVQFLSNKIKEGARFLLVVTGKGSSNGGEGVIRKNLPLWCDDKNLRSFILQVKAAQPKHGGAGASYILLRRQK